MKQRKRLRAIVTIVAMLTLSAGSIGCIELPLLTYSASFSAGWLMGTLTAPRTTHTICYRNGVEVDCSELPQFTGPQ